MFQIRCFAYSAASSSRRSIKIDWSKSMSFSASQISMVQKQCDNVGKADNSVATYLKTTGRTYFPSCPDPAVALEDLRSHNTSATMRIYRDSWLKLNNEKFAYDLVNGKDHGGRADIEGREEQEHKHSMNQIYELYFTHIVEDKPLATGADAEDGDMLIRYAGIYLKEVPLPLVKKFGIQKEFDDFVEPSKGRNVRQTAASDGAIGTKPRKRLKCPLDADPETFHANMNLLTKKGKPRQKPGRKIGSKVTENGVIMGGYGVTSPKAVGVSSVSLNASIDSPGNDKFNEFLLSQAVVKDDTITLLRAEIDELKEKVSTFEDVAKKTRSEHQAELKAFGLKETKYQQAIAMQKQQLFFNQQVMKQQSQDIEAYPIPEVSPFKSLKDRESMD